MHGATESGNIVYSRMGAAMRPPVVVDLMAKALENPHVLSLAAGFTDNAVLPREAVREASEALTRPDVPEAPLQYGTNRGRRRLRELSCEWVGGYPGEIPEAFDPAHAFITNGSQQALYLAMQVLCDPGDIVLVEAPTYFVCLEMLKGLGVRAVGLPCDATGRIDPEGMAERLRELERAGERGRVKALYLVSYHANPSSRSLAAADKEAVARVLDEAGFRLPVIEDAAYRDLYFEAPHPAPSVVSHAAFAGFPRLYLGTYTKPFATGLKVGYGYCTEPGWLEKMLAVKGHHDFGTAHFNQAVVERVLEEGLYAAHLRRIRPHYAEKADVLHTALVEGGLEEAGWRWIRPEGGLVFWVRGPEGLDLRMEQAFCRRCVETGVLYVPGDLCLPDGSPHGCARLSHGSLDTDHLREAARRFASVAAEFAG